MWRVSNFEEATACRTKHDIPRKRRTRLEISTRRTRSNMLPLVPIVVCAYAALYLFTWRKGTSISKPLFKRMTSEMSRRTSTPCWAITEIAKVIGHVRTQIWILELEDSRINQQRRRHETTYRGSFMFEEGRRYYRPFWTSGSDNGPDYTDAVLLCCEWKTQSGSAARQFRLGRGVVSTYLNAGDEDSAR